MTADALRRWLEADTRDPLVVESGGAVSSDVRGGVGLLPGSFNPLHDGHRGLAQAAAEIAALEVLFELSVTNVDKPELPEAEIRRRLAQFGGPARVVLTRAPRFVDKARAMPGSVFVLGWDTFVRLLDPRYYEDAEAMQTALLEMRDLECRFLVGGRVHAGTFRALAPEDLPSEFREMFEAIPESRFRLDISSTELRERG